MPMLLASTHVSLGFGVHDNRALSRRCGCRWWPQFRDQPPDAGEQVWEDGGASHLEGAAMSPDRSPGIVPELSVPACQRNPAQAARSATTASSTGKPSALTRMR